MKKLTLLATTIGGILAAPAAVIAEDSFFEDLSGGKVSFSTRARYEAVDQDNGLKDADNEYTAVNSKSLDTEKFWVYGQIKF